MNVYKIKKESDFSTKQEKRAYRFGKFAARIKTAFSPRPNTIFFGRDLSENTSEMKKVKEILKDGQITGNKPKFPLEFAGAQ